MSSWFRRSLFYGAAAVCTYKIVKLIYESTGPWGKKSDFESFESPVSTEKQIQAQRREENSNPRPLPFLKDIESLALCNDKANQPNKQTSVAQISGTKKNYCCQRNMIASSNPQVTFEDNEDVLLHNIWKGGDSRCERSRDISRANVLEPVSTAKADTRKVLPSNNIVSRLPFLKDIENLAVCSNIPTQFNKKLNVNRGHHVDAKKSHYSKENTVSESRTSLNADRVALLADIRKRRVLLREGKQDIARARALKWLQTPKTPKQGKVVSMMEELQTKTLRKAKGIAKRSAAAI